MPQNRARLAGLGLLAGLLTACTDGAIPTQAANQTTGFSPSASVQASSRAPVNKVSGGGKVDFSILGPPNGEETYGFNASVDGDGNVKGEFQANFSSPDVTFHAEVTCLAVNANNAWLGAVVTQTHDPVLWPVGTQGVIRVQDNGEGANDPPDALGYWVLVPANTCGLRRVGGVFGVLFPWTHGNAQVM
jgi:hypothetical protein